MNIVMVLLALVEGWSLVCEQRALRSVSTVAASPRGLISPLGSARPAAPLPHRRHAELSLLDGPAISAQPYVLARDCALSVFVSLPLPPPSSCASVLFCSFLCAS